MVTAEERVPVLVAALDASWSVGVREGPRDPENVFIIGTMNTADRSIALVDAAMRRRFAFVPLHPSEPPTSGVLRRWLAASELDVGIADLLEELNRRIEDPDFKIGPSYFMRKGVHEQGGLERAWRAASDQSGSGGGEPADPAWGWPVAVGGVAASGGGRVGRSGGRPGRADGSSGVVGGDSGYADRGRQRGWVAGGDRAEDRHQSVGVPDGVRAAAGLLAR